MSDWEDEMDNEEKKEEIEVQNVINYNDEYEDISKPVIEYKPQQKDQSEKVDYEKKYQERNKEQISMQKEIDNAVKGIKDEEMKVKKKLELQRLKQAERFIGREREEKKLELNLEKDFIELAKKNASKINEAKKPMKFTYSYLKNLLDLLCPTLESDNIKDLLNAIILIFNQKLKEEGMNSKGKSKKPKLKDGKGIQRLDRQEMIGDYGGRDDYEEEEYEDDDFM